jgi:hypothetical protein
MNQVQPRMASAVRPWPSRVKTRPPPASPIAVVFRTARRIALTARNILGEDRESQAAGQDGVEHVGSVCGMSTDKFSTETERDALCSFLDQQRDALIRKIDGLSDEDACKVGPDTRWHRASTRPRSSVRERWQN